MAPSIQFQSLLPYFYSRYYLGITHHQVFKHEVAEEFGDEERLGDEAPSLTGVRNGLGTDPHACGCVGMGFWVFMFLCLFVFKSF